MMLRAPTLVTRTTVSQEFARILDREKGAAGYRHVQILIPESPAVYVVATPDPRYREIVTQDGAPRLVPVSETDHLPPDMFEAAQDMQRALGPNRVYKGVVFPSNAQITLTLAPGQTIWAAADSRFAEVGLIVEYRS
jgi:hypothetical protein